MAPCLRHTRFLPAAVLLLQPLALTAAPAKKKSAKAKTESSDDTKPEAKKPAAKKPAAKKEPKKDKSASADK